MKRQNVKKVLLTQRDIEIFIQLWKWKFLSTHAIYRKFFNKTSMNVCYMRLLKLKKANYLDQIYLEVEEGFLWTLTSKSFEVVKQKLPDLKSYGYKSEHRFHDFWVNYCHVGPFLTENLSDYSVISEQQLRRYEKEIFPDWVPETTLHRPDGYWVYKNENKRKLTALEVELSYKSISKLERTLTFYRHSQTIDSVIWVSHSMVFLKNLKKKIELSVDESKQKHYFFKLNNLIENNWDALEEFTENPNLSYGSIVLNEDFKKPLKSVLKLNMFCMRDIKKKPIILS